MLIVGNHSGGIYMPDFWVFLRHWIRERGLTNRCAYSLGFDFLFSLPGVGSMACRWGSVPASHANAARLLQARLLGHRVPRWRTWTNYRPWTELGAPPRAVGGQRIHRERDRIPVEAHVDPAAADDPDAWGRAGSGPARSG